jgi:hypothetical protein
MNPWWYILYFGVIGSATAAAHIIGVRNAREARLATQSTREKVQRVFDGGACQAYERLDAVGRHLQDSLSAHGGTHQFTMAQLDRTLHDANLACLELGDTIADGGSSIADLQNSLGSFSRKYSELVLLLGDVAQQSGHNIAPDEGFETWAKNDRSFTIELARLIADPEFQNLFRAVRGFFNRDGFAASHSLRSVVTLGKIEAAAHTLPAFHGDGAVLIRPRDRISAH